MQVVGGQQLTWLDVHLALSAQHIVCQVEKCALWKVTPDPMLQERGQKGKPNF